MPNIPRLSQHRCEYNAYVKRAGVNVKYYASFDVFEDGDVEIQLIENYPCQMVEELVAREAYFIQTLDCVNKIKYQYASKAEFYQENKHIINPVRAERIKYMLLTIRKR
jgi:hypothetical protein